MDARKQQDANQTTLLGVLLYPVAVIGRRTLGIVDHTGEVFYLLFDALRWVWRGLTKEKYRLGKSAIVSQTVRVGVQSVFIVAIVSGAVGLILALQLAPPLDEFGQRDKIANIIAVAVLRELGPLIGAIVLTGFAGASIAILVLGVPYETYMNNMLQQAKQVDFWTGVFKGGVFGTLIGIIACANGLNVSGGAAGVGRATTYTVVECVVAIVVADLIFTAIFFALKLF